MDIGENLIREGLALYVPGKYKFQKKYQKASNDAEKHAR